MGAYLATLFLTAWTLGLAAEQLLRRRPRTERVMAVLITLLSSLAILAPPQHSVIAGASEVALSLYSLLALVAGALAGGQAWVEVKAELAEQAAIKAGRATALGL